MLSGKCILLAVTGGIAAYRAAELARLLIKQGATVRCVMTRGACEFITPLTLEALTGESVHTELFDLISEREIGHIRLVRWADVMIVAPATADTLARFAHGVCDNLVTTMYLASTCPVLLAPAMNTAMWQAGATQRNVQSLMRDGVHVVGPAEGDLACGETGPGRMSEPEAILEAVYPLVTGQLLAGQRWVVNAGPTREPWDGVRTLSNRASGQLGATLADAAVRQGAEVTLIAGPGTPGVSEGVRRVDVETAAEMLIACEAAAADCNVFVATAAVSDFRFAEQVPGKLKRGSGEQTVLLVENPDIVARIASMPARPGKVVAFAAEALEHLEHARAKMRIKGADAVFANDIARMGSATGGGWWIDAAGEQESGEMDKAGLAGWLVERVIDMQQGEME